VYGVQNIFCISVVEPEKKFGTTAMEHMLQPKTSKTDNIYVLVASTN
jgi:hypothetical protein